MPDLVSLAHNINVYDVQVSNVLHKSFSYNEHSRTVTNSGVRILSSECDLRISPDKLNGFYDFSELLRKELGITQISLDLEQPSLVQSLNSGVDRYGMLTISNPNMEADDMQKTLDEANNRIQVFFGKTMTAIRNSVTASLYRNSFISVSTGGKSFDVIHGCAKQMHLLGLLQD